MKNHSRHWETILGKESVLKWLQEIVRHGGVLMKRENAGPKGNDLITALMYPGCDNDVNFLTIFSEHNGVNKFVSAYPYIKTGTLLSGKMTRVTRLGNGVEAIVGIELEPGFEISFFATDYLINESYYNDFFMHEKCEVSLAALVYTCDFEDEKRLSFSFSGDAAKKIRTNLKEESGSEAPIYFDCSNMTMLCHINRECQDDYGFQSKIYSIETVDIMGIPMLRIGIIFDTFSGERIHLPIYVRESQFKTSEKQRLKNGQSVTGRFWIQGHLNESVRPQNICDEYDYHSLEWEMDDTLLKAWTIFRDRISERYFSGEDLLCQNFADIIGEITVDRSDFFIQTAVAAEDSTQRKNIDIVCEIRRDDEVIYHCAILLQFIKNKNTLKGIYKDLQFLENIRLQDDFDGYSEYRFYLIIPFGQLALLFVEITDIRDDDYYGRFNIVFSNKELTDEHNIITRGKGHHCSSLDADYFRIPKCLLEKLICCIVEVDKDIGVCHTKKSTRMNFNS